jgi:hypothetical protein
MCCNVLLQFLLSWTWPEAEVLPLMLLDSWLGCLDDVIDVIKMPWQNLQGVEIWKLPSSDLFDTLTG